jgi:ppGpp synthetase/RelA/SpoT-type nucleotidyltranferase
MYMNKHLTTIMSEYYQNIDIYQKLSHDVHDIINTLLEVNHIKISNMAIRIKSEEALRNKVMYKNKYTHLDEITDILGVRIITLFENDVDTVLELLEKTFEICEIVDKRKKERGGRIEFGYNSLHVVVKFNDSRCQLVEYQKFQDIRFEIQIRTVLQHAWAEVEHGLGYKSFYEPPMSVKRKLNRLAATLEILDEEFENIRYDIALYNESFDKVEKILKTDINKDSLVAYVNNSEFLNQLVERIATEQNYEIIRDTSFISHQKLATKLTMYGYQYIHELDDDIHRYEKTIYHIGHEICSQIYHESTVINLYSPIMWFTFIPVIKNLFSGMDSTDDAVLEDVIIETFRKNNNSIFEVFNQKFVPDTI